MDGSASTSSKYGDVSAQIRHRIEDGTYRPGVDLPAAAQLAAEFGVSLRTIKRALIELDRLGLTGGRQGRPRIVLDARHPGRSRYEGVTETIREDIRSGELAAGGRLPSETELVARFQVSRTTVREALAALETAGEVIQRAGRRYVAGAGEGSDLAYERVAAALRQEISTGRLTAGEKLPGELRLAALHGVSRPTVRQALTLLHQEQLLDVVPKLGWYVSSRDSAAVE